MHDALLGQTNCPWLRVNKPCILVTGYRLDLLLVNPSFLSPSILLSRC